MRRRNFIAGLVSTTATWPLVGRAQQPERMRRIGLLMPFAENDPDAMAQLSGFLQGLVQLGWTDGRNVRMDLRFISPAHTPSSMTSTTKSAQSRHRSCKSRSQGGNCVS